MDRDKGIELSIQLPTLKPSTLEHEQATAKEREELCRGHRLEQLTEPQGQELCASFESTSHFHQETTLSLMSHQDIQGQRMIKL